MIHAPNCCSASILEDNDLYPPVFGPVLFRIVGSNWFGTAPPLIDEALGLDPVPGQVIHDHFRSLALYAPGVNP